MKYTDEYFIRNILKSETKLGTPTFSNKLKTEEKESMKRALAELGRMLAELNYRKA